MGATNGSHPHGMCSRSNVRSICSRRATETVALHEHDDPSAHLEPLQVLAMLKNKMVVPYGSKTCSDPAHLRLAEQWGHAPCWKLVQSLACLVSIHRARTRTSWWRIGTVSRQQNGRWCSGATPKQALPLCAPQLWQFVGTMSMWMPTRSNELEEVRARRSQRILHPEPIDREVPLPCGTRGVRPQHHSNLVEIPFAKDGSGIGWTKRSTCSGSMDACTPSAGNKQTTNDSSDSGSGMDDWETAGTLGNHAISRRTWCHQIAGVESSRSPFHRTQNHQRIDSGRA